MLRWKQFDTPVSLVTLGPCVLPPSLPPSHSACLLHPVSWPFVYLFPPTLQDIRILESDKRCRFKRFLNNRKLIIVIIKNFMHQMKSLRVWCAARIFLLSHFACGLMGCCRDHMSLYVCFKHQVASLKDFCRTLKRTSGQHIVCLVMSVYVNTTACLETSHVSDSAD